MANLCWTDYVCVGKRDDVGELYEALNHDERRQLLKDVVEKLGGDISKMDCRGEIYSCELSDNCCELHLEMGTAWNEPKDVRLFLMKKFPKMKTYYQAIEPNDEIFQTNDHEGYFFTYRYFLDFEDSGEYFNSLEEACEYVSHRFCTEVHTVDDIEEVIDDYISEHEDAWFSFHEFEILDD